jgi:hypothetical protein
VWLWQGCARHAFAVPARGALLLNENNPLLRFQNESNYTGDRVLAPEALARPVHCTSARSARSKHARATRGNAGVGLSPPAKHCLSLQCDSLAQCLLQEGTNGLTKVAPEVPHRAGCPRLPHRRMCMRSSRARARAPPPKSERTRHGRAMQCIDPPLRAHRGKQRRPACSTTHPRQALCKYAYRSHAPVHPLVCEIIFIKP